MRIRTLLCLLILVAFALSCLGQETGSIALTLTDGRGQRITDKVSEGVHATVYLTKIPTTSLSSSRGEILLEGLEPGAYIAVVAANGFENWAIVGVPVEAGETAHVETTLAPGYMDKVVAYDVLGEWHTERAAEHLEIMKEPPLCSEQQIGKGDGYRFLWLRTFHNPILIGLNIRRSESAELSVKITDGKGGYEPGELATDERRLIPRDSLGLFLELVEDTKFWQLATRVEHTHLVVVDGAEWLIEGVRNGECHVVVRSSPNIGDNLRTLGETFLFSLADLELLYGDVY
jgi:hypothetical protein